MKNLVIFSTTTFLFLISSAAMASNSGQITFIGRVVNSTCQFNHSGKMLHSRCYFRGEREKLSQRFRYPTLTLVKPSKRIQAISVSWLDKKKRKEAIMSVRYF